MARNISEHAEQFHDNGIYLPTRTVYIDGDQDVGITNEMSACAIKNLHILDTMSTGDINVIFNCDGGDTIIGMAIYDAILACKNHVKMTVYGHASSMGSIILQAADERIMAPNAVLMVHMGQASYDGHPKVVEAWRKFDKHLDSLHETIYLAKIKAKKPRFTKDQLQKMLEHDTILTAQEAVDMGLADRVL